MDHFTYISAFSLWTLLPYIIWIILSYMSPRIAPFVTAGVILLLFTFFIHIRVAITRPQLNALSLLVAPLIQITLLICIYGLFGLIRKIRSSP